MSGGSSDPLRALICGGSPGKFAQPTEGWQACSNDDILAAAAKQLGVLQQRREWRDDVGQAREQWQELRLKLQQVYAWLDRTGPPPLVLISEMAISGPGGHVHVRSCTEKRPSSGPLLQSNRPLFAVYMPHLLSYCAGATSCPDSAVTSPPWPSPVRPLWAALHVWR